MRKDIAGYEDRYEIDRDGNVYNKKSGSKLTPDTGNGYARVQLYNSGRRKFAVHRLVAQAFIANPDELPQVDHKDEDKLNNNYKNLRWCTNKDNSSWYLDNNKGYSKIKKSVSVNGVMFESIYLASKYISEAEGKNHETIRKEISRYIAGHRPSWQMYGKYFIK